MNAPVPALYLTLSRYAHMLIGTAGARRNIVHTPHDPAGTPTQPSEYEECRSHLETALERDWPAYIGDQRRAGKLQPPS